VTQNVVKEPLCFAPSGFCDLLGIGLVALSADQAEMELNVEPKHLNSQGTLHGGVLATLVDITGGLAGCYCPHSQSYKKAVTLSLTTSFLAATSTGTIRAIGRKRSEGKSVFTASVDVFDASGNLVAIGEATYLHVHPRTNISHLGEV